MASHSNIEPLTPLDLLMPATYVQVFLTLATPAPTSTVLPRLQQGLDAVVAAVPWISGRALPTTAAAAGQPPSLLEIRWDASRLTMPMVVDKGVIPSGYAALSAQGMPPKSIPEHVWPLNPHAQDHTSGAPVFAASIFRFADGQALGLCVCVHHNAVDATGITHLLSLWARAMRGLPVVAGSRPRLTRLTDALRPELEAAAAQSVEDLWAAHPELSRAPPVLPSEFAPCACELFRMSVGKIEEVKKGVRAQRGGSPTTTNVVTALMWQAVTRARGSRDAVPLAGGTTRLVTAVNGRGRIGAGFSTPEDPYFGNVVLYALAGVPVSKVGASGPEAPEGNVADISDAIFKSQSTDHINTRSIAQLCSLVGRVDDYRGIFVGWDLFSSRDLTVTSWNGLGLYELDFGEGLGKPQHVRPPYVEADGVGFVLPRKRLGEGAEEEEEAVEVLVILRKDDMACLMRDEEWVALQVEVQG